MNKQSPVFVLEKFHLTGVKGKKIHWVKIAGIKIKGRLLVRSKDKNVILPSIFTNKPEIPPSTRISIKYSKQEDDGRAIYMIRKKIGIDRDIYVVKLGNVRLVIKGYYDFR